MVKEIFQNPLQCHPIKKAKIKCKNVRADKEIKEERLSNKWTIY